MLSRVSRVAALLIWAALPLSGQLQTIGAPYRTLRLEFGGSFNTSRDVWRNGSKISVGDLLTGPLEASATPLVGDLVRDLFPLIGHAATSTSLGSLSTVAEWQQNTGRISLGWGVSRKITLFAVIPVVSVRTEQSLTFDPSTATLGLNPGHSRFGDPAGQTKTGQFFDSFNAALALLNGRIESGAYTGSTLTLAQETAATSAQYMSALAALVSSSGSPVLPLAASADGMALLNQITTFENTFSNSLGVTGFSGSPALPTTTITTAGFNTLLSSDAGFAIKPVTGQPRTTLGRIEIGTTVELLQHDAPSNGTAIHAWGRGLLRLGTGTGPSEFEILAQGTGGRQHQVEFGGILELSKKKIGVRGDLAFTYSLAESGAERVGGANQFLIPVSRRTTVSRREGEGMNITAQPWLSIVPHMAVTGLFAYARRSDDHLSFDATTGPFQDIKAADLAKGTGASSLRVGLGLSYVHDGRNHLGILKMPVEAGFSIERTISASGGLVPSALTSTVYIRVYKR